MTRRILLHICFFFICITLNAQVKDYTSIDTYARTTPSELKNNIDSLVKYLVKPAKDDYDKARSFYTWIAEHINYDKKAYLAHRVKIYTPEKTIKRGKADYYNYSALFKTFCDKAHIKCVIVDGYTKLRHESFDNGYYYHYYYNNYYYYYYSHGDSLYKTNHAWNTFLINGDWYLTDVTKGCCYHSGKCKKQIIRKLLFKIFKIPYFKEGKKFDIGKHFDDRYFLISPDTLITVNLPANPLWQLLDCPVSVETFNRNPDIVITGIKSFLSGQYPSDIWNMPFGCYKPIEQFYENSGYIISKARNTDIKRINYNDSLTLMENLPETERIIKNSLFANTYNPKNNDITATAYYNSSNKIINDLKISTIGIETKVEDYKKAQNYLNTSKYYLNLYKKDNNDLYKSNKNVIKSIYKDFSKQNDNYIKANFKFIRNNNSNILRNKTENKKLKKENKKIQSENNNLIVENIEHVKKLQRENKPEEKKIIEDNLTLIRENRKLIKTNRQENKNLRHDIKQEQELFINDNNKQILENHKTNLGLISDNIKYKINGYLYYDYGINLNKYKIKANKDKNTEYRRINYEESEKIIADNIKLIKEKYKANKKLLKENKKYIKKNKRLNKEEGGEDQMYIEANQSFIEENNTFITGNNNMANENIIETKALNKENKALKKENKLLKLENKFQKGIFKRESKKENARYKGEVRYINALKEKYDNRLGYVKKALSELSNSRTDL